MTPTFDLLEFKETLKPVNVKTVAQFANVFPVFLINEWEKHGFSSYMEGLLITTDPNDFYEVMEEWVDDPKICHVFMRTAFGSLYYFKNGDYYDQNVFHNISSNMQDDLDAVIRVDILNERSQKNILRKPIYDKVVKRLGAPSYDEVYAFVPAIGLGGELEASTVQKVKLKEHLSFLAQLKS